MDRSTSHNGESGARRLVEAGADLAGAVGVSAVGLIFATGASGALPVAIAGGTVALASVLREIGERLLGHREKIRVGGTAIYAARAYQERADAGDHLRNDN